MSDPERDRTLLFLPAALSGITDSKSASLDSESTKEGDQMELVMAVCLTAALLRRGCDTLSARRRARLLSQLDWVADGINREALLYD